MIGGSAFARIACYDASKNFGAILHYSMKLELGIISHCCAAAEAIQVYQMLELL